MPPIQSSDSLHRWRANRGARLVEIAVCSTQLVCSFLTSVAAVADGSSAFLILKEYGRRRLNLITCGVRENGCNAVQMMIQSAVLHVRMFCTPKVTESSVVHYASGTAASMG